MNNLLDLSLKQLKMHHCTYFTINAYSNSLFPKLFQQTISYVGSLFIQSSDTVLKEESIFPMQIIA